MYYLLYKFATNKLFEFVSNSDFLHYRNRFSMPNYAETSNLHFSFNVGPVHFVSISTEVYFYDDIVERVKQQYDWLVEDLKVGGALCNQEN